MKSLCVVLAATLAATAIPLLGEECTLAAKAVTSGDIPVGFPAQLLEAGFAVVRVRLCNPGDAPVHVTPEAVTVWAPGGRKLSGIAPGKITPKLMKFYRSGSIPAGQETYQGGPYVGGRNPEAGPRREELDAQLEAIENRLLRVIEGYRLKSGPLPPGESIEGFLYFKSNRHGEKLRDGKVEFGGRSATLE